MYGGEGLFPLRVDDLVGETERQPAATSRSLLQHHKERQHLGRRLPAVPESMGRQQHDHHERNSTQNTLQIKTKRNTL